MSHEIRTPMNAVIGMAHLIERGPLTDKQKEQLKKLSMSANHLLDIINDILDLSKIEAGKCVLEQNPLSPSNLLDNVYMLLADKALEKHIELIVDNTIPSVLYLGDITRLQQVVLNFATNAVKFTSKGNVVIRGSVLEATETESLLKFEVEDTGIGLTDEALTRIFKAFEQADNSTTRKYGGTGLGLAINKKLAHLMGGTIGASSVLGVGSKFWFTVRLLNDSKYVHPTLHVDYELRFKNFYQDTAILIVDDEPINQEVVRGLVSSPVTVVDTASNGQIAIEMAQDTTYDLILMDMQMPVLNGLDATKALREMTEYKTVPILAMTANAFKEDRDKCLAAGMDDIIIKPFTPDDLFKKLVKWRS